jgi:aerobic carbon-monoxide dehydrogenase small subunit
MAIHFFINDQKVEYEGPQERRLHDILREDHNLTGTKPACEIGRCGACAVWLDARPANACLLMAWQLQDRRVTTIEGLVGADLETLANEIGAEVRQALNESGAVQCGYCSAGIVMNLSFLKLHSPSLSQEEVMELMTGNLCRCTGYAGIRRAIERLFKTGNPSFV